MKTVKIIEVGIFKGYRYWIAEHKNDNMKWYCGYVDSGSKKFNIYLHDHQSECLSSEITFLGNLCNLKGFENVNADVIGIDTMSLFEEEHTEKYAKALLFELIDNIIDEKSRLEK